MTVPFNLPGKATNMWKNKPGIVLVALLIESMLGGCAGAPADVQVSPDLRQKPSMTIAVLPFEEAKSLGVEHQETLWMATAVQGAGSLVSDMYTTELMRVPRFRLVERSQIQKILHEQDLSLSDLLAKKSAQEIGQLLGVDAVVVGFVSQFSWGTTCVPGVGGGSYSYSMRMVDVKTATVLVSTQVTGYVPQSSSPAGLCRGNVHAVVSAIIEKIK